ncbi:CoA ester lyase [Altericroceibacterium spongiae]|uniref:CoA ester lyase n=1 Tax=Altericroceibacterium spongiae TaxID=2320269 RepID=A0A420EEZ3_9SPHN|nr:CoA ester lyase [Altericroceibacterium spongiae]RKF19267.1 CoA ester lyase [Altericroceibacterium spongiae]
MRLRSLLFVPGDRPERFAKAAGSGADAIILDLEDSVAPERKSVARDAVADYLQAPRETLVLVRINPVDMPLAQDDLDAVLLHEPDGIMLPKAEGAGSVRQLTGREWKRDVPVLPIATETPAAIFELGTFREVAPHLLGLTWGAEDLPAAIGASTSREVDGSYTPPYEMARSLALFAAHAAGVPAIETVYPDFRDEAGLAVYAARGRRDGFSGMMAIHPAQVSIINAAFQPTEEELADARAIVDAFAREPQAGALSINGRMVDRPHLLQARRLIERSPV